MMDDDIPPVTLDEAFEICQRAFAGGHVDHERVLDIKAYCYVDDNFAIALYERLHLSGHFVMSALDRAVYESL
ncbi:MAG: hypothetical protein AB201_01130 [Parcubacteria bacterium C7867-006]|nr:MAG: hypothetical protein AB201_01130 [Parcubacteria bacterium C7867-006]